MIPKVVRKKTRPLWVAAAAWSAWTNRADLRRWAGFVHRSVTQRRDHSLTEVMTEAKVRVAVSADPLLRQNPALDDVEVDHGVVTMITTPSRWPDPRSRIRRLKRVGGVTGVGTKGV